MATGTILLPLNAAEPDESNAPGWQRHDTGNRLFFTFDDSTDEKCHWTFRMPENYDSAMVAYMQWSQSGGTAPGASVDTVRWAVEVMKLDPNTDTDSSATDGYATSNEVDDEADNSNARAMMECNVSLTNDDGVSAGDFVSIRLSRNANHANDTLAEDARLHAFAIQYTTT